MIINPVFDTCKEYNVYKHNYQNMFIDQIYYSKMPEDLTTKVLELGGHSTVLYNNNLAGDIETEKLLYDKSHNFLGPEYTNIKNTLLKHMQNINPNIVNIKVNNIWINYQKKNEFNPIHDHDGMFSFVWYIDVPEKIRNEYEKSPNKTPRGLIEFVSSLTSDTMIVSPKTHDILIFRANHLHNVYPFYSDATRISVSGNINDIYTTRNT